MHLLFQYFELWDFAICIKRGKNLNDPKLDLNLLLIAESLQIIYGPILSKIITDRPHFLPAQAATKQW